MSCRSAKSVRSAGGLRRRLLPVAGLPRCDGLHSSPGGGSVVNCPRQGLGGQLREAGLTVMSAMSGSILILPRRRGLAGSRPLREEVRL